jgi:hypothetical protein
MLLEVLTDKIVIDSTFSRLFGKSESSGVDWDWGMKCNYLNELLRKTYLLPNHRIAKW